MASIDQTINLFDCTHEQKSDEKTGPEEFILPEGRWERNVLVAGLLETPTHEAYRRLHMIPKFHLPSMPGPDAEVPYHLTNNTECRNYARHSYCCPQVFGSTVRAFKKYVVRILVCSYRHMFTKEQLTRLEALHVHIIEIGRQVTEDLSAHQYEMVVRRLVKGLRRIYEPSTIYKSTVLSRFLSSLSTWVRGKLSSSLGKCVSGYVAKFLSTTAGL